MKKTKIFTLDINKFEPAIRELTAPLLYSYADKIGAEVVEITEDKFPGWPVIMNKLQIYELGRATSRCVCGEFFGPWRVWDDGDSPYNCPKCGVCCDRFSDVPPSDWNIFFDADCLIHPEFFDPTEQIGKDTVLFNGKDMANIRFTYDQYFRRDGRNLGACSWFFVCSDQTLDLVRPPDDQTPEELASKIRITVQEANAAVKTGPSLADDYTLSRNIARFGLKHDTLIDICGKLGWRTQEGRPHNPFLWHMYSVTNEEKLFRMVNLLSTPQDQAVFDFKYRDRPVGNGWGLMSQRQAQEFKEKWGLKW